MEFLDGTTVIGTKALSSGEAQITTSLLPTGTNALRAVYGGDPGAWPGIWGPSTSVVVDQVVNPVAASGFAAAVNYPAGGLPQSVAVGDFNGDGKADRTVAGTGVNVLLGKGDGTFQAAVNYFAGDSPDSVAVADFNSDGNADLAVADYLGGVSVLLGKGDGTFQAAVNYFAGGTPISVAVGDFNGDGNPDLALATVAGVSVLLGNANGTFQAAVNYPGGERTGFPWRWGTSTATASPTWRLPITMPT